MPLVFALIGASDGPSLTARAGRWAGGSRRRDADHFVAGRDLAPSARRARAAICSPWMSAGRRGPDSALRADFSEIGRKKMVLDGLDKLICDLETE